MPGKLHGAKDWDQLLKRYGESVARKLERAFDDSAMELAAYSRRIAPVSPRTERRGGFRKAAPSGRIRQSVTHEVSVRGAKFVGAWGTNVKEAIFPEFGTRPHTIMPRQRKMLRFYAGPGKVAYARRVRHPGVRVGTPERPLTTWRRKQIWGGSPVESMPFIRPAWSALEKKVMRRIRDAGAL